MRGYTIVPESSLNSYITLPTPTWFPTPMGFVNPGKDIHQRIRGMAEERYPRHRSRRKPPHSTLTATSSSAPSRRRKHPRAQQGQEQKQKPKPAMLITLPTELLQSIFLAALNPALATSCRALSQVLTGRHLRLRYVHEHRHCAQDLTRIFTSRFFTASFLDDYEAHFSLRLDGTGAFLPLGLLSEPWDGDGDGDGARARARLIKALTERGARWGWQDDEQRQEAVLDGLHSALRWGAGDVVAAVLMDPSVGIGKACLRLAAECDCAVEVFESLFERAGGFEIEGASVSSDVELWRAALQAHGGVLAWLLHWARPPSEVLGELGVWTGL